MAGNLCNAISPGNMDVMFPFFLSLLKMKYKNVHIFLSNITELEVCGKR